MKFAPLQLVCCGTFALRDRKARKPPLRPPLGAGRGAIRGRRRRRARVYVRRDEVVALVPVVGPTSELAGQSKLFLRLGRYTLIEHVVRRLGRCVGSIVVAVPAAHVDGTRAILGESARVCATADGYRKTLRKLMEEEPAPLVVVHGVSWPLASPRLIREVILGAADTGAAAAVAHFPGTSVARLDSGKLLELEQPASLAIAQSPWAFRRDVLVHALALAEAAAAEPGTIWELLQGTVAEILPVANEPWNVRIETALDWEIARRAVWPLIRHGPGRWPLR